MFSWSWTRIQAQPGWGLGGSVHVLHVHLIPHQFVNPCFLFI